jgi:hypothetical protein
MTKVTDVIRAPAPPNAKQHVRRYFERPSTETHGLRVMARVTGRFLRRLRFLRFTLQMATKRRADERTRTADLISLRVISQALQGLAQGGMCRISKPVPLFCLAQSWAESRSRWCQSGVNTILQSAQPCCPRPNRPFSPFLSIPANG